MCMKGYWVRVKSDASIDQLLAERRVRNVRPAQVRGPKDNRDERHQQRKREKPAELTACSAPSTPIVSWCQANIQLWCENCEELLFSVIWALEWGFFFSWFGPVRYPRTVGQSFKGTYLLSLSFYLPHDYRLFYSQFIIYIINLQWTTVN